MRCNSQVVNRANTSFPVKPQLFQRTVSKVDLAFQNRLNSLPRILVCNTEHSLYVHIRTVNLFSLMHCIKIGPKRSCPNCSLTTGNFNNSHAAQKQDHKFFTFYISPNNLFCCLKDLNVLRIQPTQLFKQILRKY